MQRIDKLWWCVVALLGATMVMLGAYAAHGLSARTSAAMVDIVETGKTYMCGALGYAGRGSPRDSSLGRKAYR